MLPLIYPAAALAAAGCGLLYKKFLSKEARDERAEHSKRGMIAAAGERLDNFTALHKQYTALGKEYIMLDKTRSIWVESAEDDPTARDMIRDIENKMNVAYDRRMFIKDEIIMLVSEIFRNKSLSTAVITGGFPKEHVDALVKWKKDFASEIDSALCNCKCKNK